jgi:hypothetical protein
VHHAHDEDVERTHAGEPAPESWPDPSPDRKGLEGSETPV